MTNQPTNQPTRFRPRPAVVAVLGKGGSGKTTSTAALGDALADQLSARVQLVDLDAQASLTAWLLPHLPSTAAGVEDLLAGDVPDVASVLHPLRPGLAVVPATNGLALTEPALPPQALRARLLDDPDAGDLLLLDTPALRPLGPGAVLLRMVLAAADVAVVPFRCTVLDLDALAETLQQVRAHERIARRRLPVLLLPTMTTRDGAADLLSRALRLGGLHVLPAVPLSSWAAKAVGARQLLATRAPRGAGIVDAYAEAAAELAATLPPVLPAVLPAATAGVR